MVQSILIITAAWAISLCFTGLTTIQTPRGPITNEPTPDCEAKLGQDHHYTLTVAVNLASDLAVLGDTDRALGIGDDTLARLGRVLGPDHPLTLGCAANMVIDYRRRDDEHAAERLAVDTMRRYRQTLGDGHPDTVAAAEGRRLDFDFDSPQI